MKNANATTKRNLAKSLFVFGLSASILFAPVLTGCKPNSPTVNDPNDTATTPGEDQPSNPTTTPGTNTGTNPGNTTTPTNPYEGYSKTLQTVLTSEVYNNLIDEYLEYLKANNDSWSYANKYSKHANYVGHPFGFLEKKGYDINAIKNGNIECSSDAYTCEGDFFIKTMVAVNDTIPYYDCYILKYGLTKQEKEDLDYLFNGNYYQAPLFIQQLSYDKDAEVVSNAKQSIAAYKDLSKNFCDNPKYSKNILMTSTVNIILTYYKYTQEYDTKYQFYNVYTNPQKYNNAYAIERGRMAELKFWTSVGEKIDIVCAPTNVNSFEVYPGYETVLKDIEWYSTSLYLNNYHNNMLND